MIKAIIFDLLDVLYPDIGDSMTTLKSLRDRGISCVTISNMNRDRVLELVERFHLDGYYIASDLGLSKSDPAIYQKFLDDSGFRGEECVFVDDKIDNLLAAKTLGISTVLMSKMPSSRDNITATITQLEKLLPIVDNLEK
jgi:putative hydrolase of the HAD superfamily